MMDDSLVTMASGTEISTADIDSDGECVMLCTHNTLYTLVLLQILNAHGFFFGHNIFLHISNLIERDRCVNRFLDPDKISKYKLAAGMATLALEKATEVRRWRV